MFLVSIYSFRTNIFKSNRLKRRQIQEQLFAYTSKDVTAISLNVYTESSTNK